jgi:hypothetical protein
MPIFRSHKEVQRAELRTVGWFAYAMFWLTIAFVATVGGCYLLGGQ